MRLGIGKPEALCQPDSMNYMFAQWGIWVCLIGVEERKIVLLLEGILLTLICGAAHKYVTG